LTTQSLRVLFAAFLLSNADDNLTLQLPDLPGLAVAVHHVNLSWQASGSAGIASNGVFRVLSHDLSATTINVVEPSPDYWWVGILLIPAPPVTANNPGAGPLIFNVPYNPPYLLAGAQRFLNPATLGFSGTSGIVAIHYTLERIPLADWTELRARTSRERG